MLEITKQIIGIICLCMIFLGCTSTIGSWELPASHPANPAAEEAKISQPMNPFRDELSMNPNRLKEDQPSYQNTQSEIISSGGTTHGDHPNNINKDHSERKDIDHNHKESNQ